MHLIRRILLLSLTLGLIAGILLSLILVPSLVLYPHRPAALPSPAYTGPFILSETTLSPEPNIKLSGFVLTPYKYGAIVPTIILVHGISSSKNACLDFANSLCAQGFRVVAFDSRAHGLSEGGHCTYGWHEKNDIRKIVDFVRTLDPAGRIGIFGNSLGGAIALQAMALDPRIQCGVIESTFAEFIEAARLRAAAWAGFRVDPFLYPGLWRAAAMADWKPFQVSPERSALSISHPVMMIHGTDDTVFPPSHGERIFRNLSSPDKAWILVAGGRHHGLSQSFGPGYEDQMVLFFKKNLMPQ